MINMNTVITKIIPKSLLDTSSSMEIAYLISILINIANQLMEMI